MYTELRRLARRFRFFHKSCQFPGNIRVYGRLRRECVLFLRRPSLAAARELALWAYVEARGTTDSIDRDNYLQVFELARAAVREMEAEDARGRN